MRRTMRTLTLFALLGVLLAPAADAQRRTFEGETSTVIVEVPVTVIHDGEAVRGLTKSDFEIREGRKRHEILDFEIIDLATISADSTTAAGDPLPMSARRHFLMLFDFTFARPGTVARARTAAQKLVLEELHPTDLVGVATYGSSGPRMILGFTSDRRQIDLALEGLGIESLLQGVQLTTDPLQLMVAEPNSVNSALAASNGSADIAGSGGDGGLAGNAASREALATEELRGVVLEAQRQDRQFQTNQVMAMSRALADLADLLASADGRKHVVYMSEGFDTSLFLGDELSDADSVDIMRGGGVTSDSNERFGDTRLLSDIDDMLESFRRADATIQAVDISGLEASHTQASRRMTEQGLFYFANETGGEVFESYNDLGAAMRDMLQRNSVTYLLTFRADDLEPDGEYHKLEVRVENVPRRAKINHRAGYYAPLPYGQQNPLAQRLTTAQDLLSAEPSSDFATAALAPAFAGSAANARSYVPVVLEIDGDEFLRGVSGGTVGVELFVYALNTAGGVEDFFTQRVDIDTSKAGDAMRQSGLKLFGHVNVPEGSHTVRVLVRNSVTGATSLQVAEIDVPDHRGSGPVLMPAFFPEAPGTWIAVPEPADKRRKDVNFPFMLKDQPYLPAVQPALPANQNVFVNLIAYNLGSGSPEVSARVLDASGKPAGNATLTLQDRFQLEGDSAERMMATLSTRGLGAGSYRLEVTLTDPASGQSSTSTAPFRIGSSG